MTEENDLGLETEITLRSKIEALIFAAAEPLKISELQALLEVSVEEIKAEIKELQEFYRRHDGGFKLDFLKDRGYQFRTISEASPLIGVMYKRKPRALSRAAQEVLAIIAYRQPVSRADIDFLRGVESGNIIKQLLERDLLACVGRRETSPGKPMLFGTTPYFLEVYGLDHLDDLPPLESMQPNPNTVETESKLDSISAESEEPPPELVL